MQYLYYFTKNGVVEKGAGKKIASMDSNLPIQQILERYKSSDKTDLLHSYGELKSLNIDLEFIFVLLRTFEEESNFNSKDYDQFSLVTILDYIERTHTYYLSKRLHEIEQTIDLLIKSYDKSHPLLLALSSFFLEYKSRLAAHIKAEENFMLPYIKSLLKFEKHEINVQDYFVTTKDNSMDKILNAHDDVELDLAKMREALVSTETPDTSKTLYRILITQLESFEKDLLVHGLVEDFVLIPRAKRLEENLNEIFSEMIRWN
jgi:regulator of cell morphogenesis and NO signaling